MMPLYSSSFVALSFSLLSLSSSQFLVRGERLGMEEERRSTQLLFADQLLGGCFSSGSGDNGDEDDEDEDEEEVPTMTPSSFPSTMMDGDNNMTDNNETVILPDLPKVFYSAVPDGSSAFNLGLIDLATNLTNESVVVNIGAFAYMVTDPVNQLIYYASSSGIFRAQYDGTEVEQLEAAGPRLGGLALDAVNNDLYIVDSTNTLLLRLNLTDDMPTTTETLLQSGTGLARPFSVAVDPGIRRSLIYIANTDAESLFLCDFHNPSSFCANAPTGSKPWYVVVDPTDDCDCVYVALDNGFVAKANSLYGTVVDPEFIALPGVHWMELRDPYLYMASSDDTLVTNFWRYNFGTNATEALPPVDSTLGYFALA